MVKEEWRGPAADSLMNLDGCSAAKFSGIEYVCCGDGTVASEDLGEKGNRRGGTPWIVPGVGSCCVSEGGYEVGRPGAVSWEFAVRAVSEASTEGSTEVGGLREKMLLMLFCVGH